MPHWQTMIPSEYLKASDFATRDYTLTIVRVERRELDKLGKPGKDDSGGKEKRGVVLFRETEKILPLNKTNGTALAHMFGSDTDGWAGKRVTFYSGRDKLGRDDVDAVRVRGGPDLERDIDYEFRRNSKTRPTRTRLVRTGKAGAVPLPVGDGAEEPHATEPHATEPHADGATEPSET